MPIGSVFGAFFSVYITLYCLNCGIIMNVYAVMTMIISLCSRLQLPQASIVESMSKKEVPLYGEYFNCGR